MVELLKHPWPWYVSGPLIGLTVPLLLIFGNKVFGLSSSLGHICAACFPSGIPFFQYEWRKEVWNLFFVAGVLVGAFFTWYFLTNYEELTINPKLAVELGTYGIMNTREILPMEIINWHSLLTLKGFIMIIAGGFLVGFGTRYGGGCTSGHAISGLSNLQWPSLVATCSFMAAGFLVANFILPFILKL